MIAGRRDRSRSLIRSNTVTNALARSMSSRKGVAAFPREASSEFGYSAPVYPYTTSGSQPEPGMFLRQLSTLRAAGILTDEEYKAARGRLLGS